MEKELEIIHRIVENVEKVIIGKREEIMTIMKGIIANGHILLEDVPGVGKTTLVKTLSKTLNLSFNRIQFTPDLLPSDITGVSIYNQKNGEFEYKKGPVFANIILADEINRASPKTQSALLEVMEEKQVSDGVKTYSVGQPFIVLATENPLEYEGTFVLPEAQLDRFMIKAKMGYPKFEDEVKILEIYKKEEPIYNIESVASKEEIVLLQKKVRDIYVNEEINKYIVNIIDKTRKSSYLVLGGSTRASLSLLRIAQATALIKNRDYVIPEDVKENVEAVLCHRIIPSSLAKANNMSREKIIRDIMRIIPAPMVK